MDISRRAVTLGLAGGLSASLAGLAAKAGTLSYEYDLLGRLTKVTYPDGAFTLYMYDALGNRTQRYQIPWTPTFTATIAVTGTGPVNLRTLANAIGYPGNDAIITFEVGSGVTIMGDAGAGGASNAGGTAGGIGITTGTWPSGPSISLTLDVKAGGSVLGGGGGGGGGGGSDPFVHDMPGSGGGGGAAVSCTYPLSVIVRSGGKIAGGGDGGAGGNGYEEAFYNPPNIDYGWFGGGGGGGGYPNGAGGEGGVTDNPWYYYDHSGSPGDPGTTSAGGAGGRGGYIGALSGEGDPGVAGGAAGGAYAIAKNGNTVSVSNSGTITGSIV